MKRHLPRGRWTTEMLDLMPWRERTEISRYKYRGTKKWAKRRIHKMERQEATEALRQQEWVERNWRWLTAADWPPREEKP